MSFAKLKIFIIEFKVKYRVNEIEKIFLALHEIFYNNFKIFMHLILHPDRQTDILLLYYKDIAKKQKYKKKFLQLENII